MKTVIDTPKVPEISNKILYRRMRRIRWVVQVMKSTEGKALSTSETDENLFSLFYKKSSVYPRGYAFNFDENAILEEEARGLIPLRVGPIYVKIGGYYGFCKISFAEIMSQIPEDILEDVVAFSLDPNSDPQIVNSDYQENNIIFYSKDPNWIEPVNNYPSVKDLIKPVNITKAKRLKNRVKPILNYLGEGLHTIEPEDIEKSFMRVGIWMRVNGSNLHKVNKTNKLTESYKQGKKISTYRALVEDDGADYFYPNYAETISQIPDELITENTIGFQYTSTDYFLTKEGVVHKTDYVLIEKK